MSLGGRLGLAASLALAGMALGGWLTVRHYQPQLDAARVEQARCADMQGRLDEQNRQVQALAQATEQRAQAARQALESAERDAARQDDAAQRLLLEHSTGEDCAVARQLIDRELLP